MNHEQDENESPNENEDVNFRRTSKKQNLLYIKGQDVFTSSYRTRAKYDELKLIHIIRFITNQSHKYFIFILAVCYFKFTQYNFINLFFNPSPMWVIYQKSIIDLFTLFDFFGIIFLFYPYSFSSSEVLNPFWIPLNEITFFVFTTIIIFICYKKNWRMDLIFVSLFIFVISFKIFYFFQKDDPKLYPMLGNYTDGNASFYQSPLYNYTFYIIGLFFGQLNYVIQKSITKTCINRSGRTFLKFHLYFVGLYKNNLGKKVAIITIVGIALIIFLIFGYPIFYNFIGTDGNNSYLMQFNQNVYLNFFYLLDTEFFVLIVFVLFFSLFIFGENLLVDFFSHEYWGVLSNSYFSLIIICDTVILLIFYQSELRIKFEVYSILFFSLFFILFICIISFNSEILFTYPYKQLFKKLWSQNNNNLDKRNSSSPKNL